jgi:signal peptidase I
MATQEFRKSIAREYFESLVIAVVLALFIRTYVVQAFKIPSGSMEPNLLVGDHLLVNKFVFGPAISPVERAVLPMKDIQRLDIVVFKHPKDPERDLIKRIIGLPGETLELRRKRVFINGKPLDEPYAHFMDDPPATSEEMDPRVQYGPVTVPPGQYFAMGDNRDNSEDSRYWGFLPRENIKGKALVIYWSYDGESDFLGTRWNRLLHQVR